MFQAQAFGRAPGAFGKEAILHPAERCIAFRLRRSAASHGDGIEPVAGRNRFADAGAIEPVILVGRIVDGFDSSRADNFGKFGTAPVQQWPHDPAVHRAHAGQPADPGAPIEAHQQGFGLIVGMMRGQDCHNPVPACPLFQQRVAGRARGGLDRTGDWDQWRKDRMGNAQRCANFGDMPGFLHAFGPQAVIDGGSERPVGVGAMAEEQEREAIRPSRNGNA